MSDTSCGCDNLPVVKYQIPGNSGPAGADGVDGTDGINAFTFTDANFTQPAVNANVTISVTEGSWAAVGENIWIEQGGTYEVITVNSAISLTVENLGYTGNAPPTTVIPSGVKVSPSGIKGTDGSSAAGDLLSTNNLSDVASVAASRTNLGLGALAVLSTVNDGEWSGTDLAVVNGGTGGSTAAAARTNLGLVYGTNVQAYDALLQAISGLATVADRLIYTTGVDLVSLTTLTAYARTLLDDADAIAGRATLGVNRTLQDMLVFEQQQATTVAAGTFTSGAWQTVPLNTEVIDTGAQGSIAVNIITLAAGTYRYRGRLCGYQVGNFQCRLWNVDAATLIAYGSNTTSAAADGCVEYSLITGRFTIAVSTQIRLEGQCQTTNAGDGFGLANSFGGTECYSAIEFEREVG